MSVFLKLIIVMASAFFILYGLEGIWKYLQYRQKFNRLQLISLFLLNPENKTVMTKLKKEGAFKLEDDWLYTDKYELFFDLQKEKGFQHLRMYFLEYTNEFVLEERCRKNKAIQKNILKVGVELKKNGVMPEFDEKGMQKVFNSFAIA